MKRHAAITSLTDAVAELVHDGDTVALEGFTHLIPVSAGHEIIRQRRRDLTLVRLTPDIVYDQLIGAGCARKLIFSWGGNPGVGSLHRFRDAIENGWPEPLEIEEHSHAGLANPYVAGASGLPFAVHARLPGTDLPEHTADDRADHLPVHRRDADRRARARSRRRDHPRAARRPRRQRAAVGPDRRAEGGGAGGRALARHRRGDRRRARPAPQRGRAPDVGRHAVAEVPGGARPSYAHDYYERDNAYYKEWDAISKDRDRFGEWVAALVRGERAGVSWTADEMMSIAAARALADGASCFVGIGLPSTAANLARRTHAPALVLIYEAGAIGAKPDRLPLSIGDGILAETADAVVSVPEVFNYWVQPGRIDVGFLGAAQIDRFANINTTVIGPDYAHPKVRLPGAGGAPEIAASLRRGRRDRAPEHALVRRAGGLRDLRGATARGPGDRERLGLRGRGPVRVITDLGVLEPDPETRASSS